MGLKPTGITKTIVSQQKKTNGNKKNEIPVITEETLADARIAIEGGKENNALENIELVEETLEKLKGKNMRAASELLLTVALVLDPVTLHFQLNQLKGLCVAKAMHQLASMKSEETSNE